MGVKTSLVQGSQAVTENSEGSGLQNHFDTLGFGPSIGLPHRRRSIPSCPPPRAMSAAITERWANAMLTPSIATSTICRRRG